MLQKCIFWLFISPPPMLHLWISIYLRSEADAFHLFVSQLFSLLLQVPLLIHLIKLRLHKHSSPDGVRFTFRILRDNSLSFIGPFYTSSRRHREISMSCQMTCTCIQGHSNWVLSLVLVIFGLETVTTIQRLSERAVDLLVVVEGIVISKGAEVIRSRLVMKNLLVRLRFYHFPFGSSC